jgi:hypothetical protein
MISPGEERQHVMNITVYEYGTRQNSLRPGPQFKLVFRSPENHEAQCVVDAIVDSGAVSSSIPRWAVERIGRGNLVSESTYAYDFDNRLLEIMAHEIDVAFGNSEFPRMFLAETSREYALIGRDILNAYYVHLNAPERRWGVHPPCE